MLSACVQVLQLFYPHKRNSEGVKRNLIVLLVIFPLGLICRQALYVLVAFVPLQASGFHISVEIAA